VGALDRISVAAIGTSVADLEAETLRAEVAGVECVWAPELFRSAVTQAAYLAAKTERIGVATGIVPSSTRSARSTSTRCPAAASGSGWGRGSNG
jgi:alkanesulfonate monooxygenase SsuD/methylene tetrahydromethanopterin reductase-like flavin-dependent oxidoreductase (luciferase family)